MPDTVHNRDDCSAWGGNGELAMFTGWIFAHIQKLEDAQTEVSMPCGYAPLIDVTWGEHRFRLRIEEVRDGTYAS
jgi:hypothetical protein